MRLLSGGCPLRTSREREEPFHPPHPQKTQKPSSHFSKASSSSIIISLHPDSPMLPRSSDSKRLRTYFHFFFFFFFLFNFFDSHPVVELSDHRCTDCTVRLPEEDPIVWMGLLHRASSHSDTLLPPRRWRGESYLPGAGGGGLRGEVVVVAELIGWLLHGRINYSRQ